MNYSCELIRDLYPLYVPGDLSPSVKKEVEGHLKECDACSSIYKRGEGFDQILELDDKVLDVPKSLDERIQMRLKLRRWKMVVFILCGLILLIFINQYQDNRKELFITYEDVYRGANALIDLVETAPDASDEELDFLKDMYFGNMYEGIEQLTHTFNWLENQKYDGSTLFIEQQSFYTALDNLNLRKQDGRWDETDEKTYNLLKKYASEYKREVEEDYRKFNDGYSSYFETVDVKDLSVPIEAINMLTFTYNRFHQLPNQVRSLNEDELKERISAIFQVNPDDILIDESSDFRYRFKIQERDISGELDAFTSYPIRMSSFDSQEVNGELLDVKKVQKNVKSMLDRIYGEDKSFSIEYLGVNVNYSSNIDDKYYTFGVMPTFESLPLYAFSDRSITIYFDARSGQFRMMNSLEDVPLPHDFNLEITGNVTPEQGLNVYQEKVEVEDKELVENRTYEYIDTFVIYSSTSGGLVPVHAYGLSEHDSTWRYINIETGKEELLFYEH